MQVVVFIASPCSKYEMSFNMLALITSDCGCVQVVVFIASEESTAIQGVRCPTRSRVGLLTGDLQCVIQDFNSGRQLLLPPANWCPIFASRTTQIALS